MKQEQKTHVSADALIQLLKGAKAIRWQLALGVVMSLALVVCALIIPTQMGALVQILMEKTKMMPGRIMVLLVVTGAVISALGWYEPFQDYAGAGASVPLLGFGNVLMKGVKEAVQEQGFLGLFAGGFKAGAVGTSAALILGYLASLLSKPKMKE